MSLLDSDGLFNLISYLIDRLTPSIRKINGKSLEADITLSSDDIGIPFATESEAAEGIAADKVMSPATTKLAVMEKIDAALRTDSGTITLTNTLTYPFNNSAATVSLAAPRDNTNYSVDVDAGFDAVGNIGHIYVYDKLVNGFKIAFTGSAASVTVKYTVRGGIN